MLVIFQSFTNLLQKWITNDLPMQFLCYCHYQSFDNKESSFLLYWSLVILTVAVATIYSNLLYQCFTKHYQSDSVLYIISLPMITNKFRVQIIASYFANCEVSSSYCNCKVVNHMKNVKQFFSQRKFNSSMLDFSHYIQVTSTFYSSTICCFS